MAGEVQDRWVGHDAGDTGIRGHGAPSAPQGPGDRQLAAKMWVDPGLVFTTSVGTAIEPRNANRAWNSSCDRAGTSRPDGQRVRIHDLRHTAATWPHGEGVDMKTI